MSSKHKKWSERTDVVSIMLSLMTTGILAFITPGFGIFFYVADIWVILGMLVGSWYIIKKEAIFIDKIINLLKLTFIGGFATAFDLTVIYMILALIISRGYNNPGILFLYWYIYIIITQLIIAGLIILFYYIKDRSYLADSK